MATSEVIKLPLVRLSFAKLFKPKAFREGQDKRFEAAFLLDPSNEKHKAVIDVIISTAAALLKDHFGDKIPASAEIGFGYSDARPIMLGDFEWRGKKKDYDGYEGMFYVTSANKTRPTVVDRDRSPLAEEDGKPYSGAFVNGSITLWVQDNEFGKRINANLRAVQFVKDGEAFGVKPVDAEDEFDVIDDIDGDGEDFLD